jgi:hypothetical protein
MIKKHAILKWLLMLVMGFAAYGVFREVGFAAALHFFSSNPSPQQPE